MLETATHSRLGRVHPRLHGRTISVTTVLRAGRWVDVDTGEVRSPAVVVVEGERITALNPSAPLPDSVTEIRLGDLTLLPGLMDMELNLLIGGPGGPDGLPTPLHGVPDDPPHRTPRGAVHPRPTFAAGVTPPRPPPF